VRSEHVEWGEFAIKNKALAVRKSAFLPPAQCIRPLMFALVPEWATRSRTRFCGWVSRPKREPFDAQVHIERIRSTTISPTRTVRRRQIQRVSLRALAGRNQPSKDAPSAETGGVLPLATSAVSDIWELDFYSRPVVGADGKRLWELVVCDRDGSFVHVEAFPNNMVNSRELARAVKTLIEESSVRPRIVRFFRAQMRNMIQIAMQNISGVETRPSRRTYALFLALAYRERNVYPRLPGYEGKSIGIGNRSGTRGAELSLAESIGNMLKTPVDLKVAARLPDELQGDRFAFVTILLRDVTQMNAAGFGELCPVSLSAESMNLDIQMRTSGNAGSTQSAALDLGAPSPETLVPGVVIYSRRALPLAAWFSGTELAYIIADEQRKEIYLECGLDAAYLFARIQPSLEAEARAFNEAKKAARGLHFLAIQEKPDDEDVCGFWLLRDVAYL